MKIENTGTGSHHIRSDASLVSDHLKLPQEIIALLEEKRILYMGLFYQLTSHDLHQYFREENIVEQIVNAAEAIGFPPGMRNRHPLAQVAFG